jgi:hypothetical protein
MKRILRLVFLIMLAAAPLTQASAFGLLPTLFLVGPGLPVPAEVDRVNRINRSSFDRTPPFVISTFDAAMVEEFNRAWSRAAAGTVSSESVVLILRMANGGYSARSMGFSNEYKAFTFPWHPATVAIIHTHPNKSGARPMGQDLSVADKYHVPIFTITNRGMYVYDPATKQTTKVMDGLDWLDASKWQKAAIAEKR